MSGPLRVERVRLPALLASTSVVALLMGGTAPAAAQCSNYSNTTAAGCTNPSGTTIPGLTVSNSTVNGGITNSGSITPDGIAITNSTINGSILGNGIIAGGLSIDQTSSIYDVGAAATLAGVDIGGQSFSGNLSNAGTITVDPSSVSASFGIYVQSSTSFTGNIINAGTIDASASGANAFSVGILVDNSNGLATFAGSISNGGSITVNSAVTGGAYSCGAYGISVSGIGSLTGGISNSGSITVNNSLSGYSCGDYGGISVSRVGSFTGGISNAGSITVNNVVTRGFGCSDYGISVLSTRSFAGGISNGGTINVSNSGSNIGAAGIYVGGVTTFTGGISNGGTIDASAIGPNAYSGGIVVQGVRTFTGGIANSGTIIAAGNSGTGIYVVNVTSFQGGITNTGSITGNVGILVSRSGPVSLFDSGTIVGTGGTAVDLSGNAAGNTFTLGAGYNITGKVVGQGSDTFQLGGTGTGSFDLSTIGSTQQYQGFTSFNVVGGTWITSNIFGQSQAWNVNGGTLAGTGTFNSLNINNGGTLMPGTAGVAGTITVNGNLAFQSGAIYLVQLNNGAASFANVGGTATLGGAVQLALASGATTKSYDILHAAGGFGGTAFAGATNLNPNYAVSLSQTTTDVFLNLTAQLGHGSALNPGQQNAAGAINNFFNDGPIPSAVASLFTLTGPALASALSQASGESATGSQQTTFQAMSQFMGLLTDPFAGRGGGINGSAPPTGYAEEGEASSYAASRRTSDAYAMFTKAPLAKVYEPRWSVWASGFGGSQSTSGNALAGTNDMTSRIAGTAVGADYLFSPNTLAGFALAGGGTSFGVNNLGSGRSDLFQAGAYVRHTEGNAYIAGALAYGWQDITTNRTVTIAGLDQLRAEFNANAFSGRVEGGYRFVAPWVGGVGITPYAAGQFTTFELPAYAESVVAGSPNFALAYGAQSVTDARSELGFRTDKSFAMANGILTLRGRLAWAHDFDPDRSIGATFQALPGASFVVNGAAQASDSALTTVSAEMKWTNHWSAAATFEGEFSNVTSSYAGKGVVRYTW